MIPTLTTARLKLRPVSQADAGRFLEIFNGPQVLRYFPNPAPATRERILRFIQHQITHWNQYGYGHWGIERSEEGDLIGWAGLQFLPETKETEVAYMLGRPYWGKGYASEAAQAALQYGFETLGLQQIIALVHPDNWGSNHVIEKLGMPFCERKEYFGMQVNRYVKKREPDG